MTQSETGSSGGHSPEDLVQLRRKLMAFFQWNHSQSPEDEAQETISRALARINDPETVFRVPLKAYVFGIARNVLHESRRQTREAPTDPGSGEFTNLQSNHALSAEDSILVEECLSQVSKQDGHLLLDYHRRGAEVLAKEMKISSNALRIRVHRIQKRIQALMLGGEES